MRLFLLFVIFQAALQGKPLALYLTWESDPLSTITVQWITEKDKGIPTLAFREAEKEIWTESDGMALALPGLDDLLLFRTTLKSLSPGTDYLIYIDGATYKFRTLPSNLNAPVRFVEGGDIFHDSIEQLEKTNRQAALQSPHFAVVGGDLAYAGSRRANGFGEQPERWVEWLKAWQRTMITPAGHLIPLVPAIGNHDVNGRFGVTPKEARFFYTLFPFPGESGCNVLDFGNWMSFLILDSGHTHPIEGVQTKWLRETLMARQEREHLFAAYHVPAYPSVRKFMKTVSAKVRRYWVPQFEKYHLSAAFEHHEHAYKRTKPIKEGRVHEKGIIYLGDGAWGVEKPRRPKTAWYIAKAARESHFILVTVENGLRAYSAISSEGKLIDSYIQRKG